MGLSRLAYSLSTNRQIPSAVGRLHPTRSTPYVVITIAALLAAGLTVPQDLELMVGIFAYGALVGLTIAHLSIVVLRYKEPDGRRPYRIPLSVRVRGGDLPLLGGHRRGPQRRRVGRARRSPTAARAGWAPPGSPAAWCSTSSTARRRASRSCARVLVPEAALRGERHEAEYGSILVPLTGLAARRRHHPDGGPPGRRGGRRRLRGGQGRHHRGAVDLRGPDVAADRRRAPRCPAQAGAGGAGAGQGGGGGVRGRRGRHRDGPRAPRRAGDRRRGQAPRRAGRRARRRGAVEDPRRGAAGRPRRPAGRLRGGVDQVRALQGAVPGHPHRAARLRQRTPVDAPCARTAPPRATARPPRRATAPRRATPRRRATTAPAR